MSCVHLFVHLTFLLMRISKLQKCTKYYNQLNNSDKHNTMTTAVLTVKRLKCKRSEQVPFLFTEQCGNKDQTMKTKLRYMPRKT